MNSNNLNLHASAGNAATNTLLGATASGNGSFRHPASTMPTSAAATHVVPPILSAPGNPHPQSGHQHQLAALASMMIPATHQAAPPVTANPVVSLIGAAQAAAAGYQAGLAAAAAQQQRQQQQQQQQQGHPVHHLAVSQAQAQAQAHALAFSQAALLTSSNSTSSNPAPSAPAVVAQSLTATAGQQQHHHQHHRVVAPSGGAHTAVGAPSASVTVPSLPPMTRVPSGGVPSTAGVIPHQTNTTTTMTNATNPAVGSRKSPTPPLHPATTTSLAGGTVPSSSSSVAPSVVSASGSVCSGGQRSLSSAGGGVVGKRNVGAGSSSSTSSWCPVVKGLTPLEEARLREDKKAAKRIANRKSASNSRARRKAYVEELAQTNARLRRQALILSHIPDLVLTVAASDGTISFASDQVERTLKRNAGELVGTSLYDTGEGGLVAPASKEVVRKLVRTLLGTDGTAGVGGKNPPSGGGEACIDDTRSREETRKPLSVSCGAAETALSCVTASTDFGATVSEVDNSERSICNPDSSLDDKARMDVAAASGRGDPTGASLAQVHTKGSNSDMVTGRKASFDAITTSSDKESSRLTFESLKQHSASEKDLSAETPAMNGNTSKTNDISENSSLDSGYRASSSDSFPSRQESMSSSDNIMIDGKNGVAPSCNVCLLGEDGTPIWCEVTASVGSSRPDLTSEESTLPSKDASSKKGSRPISSLGSVSSADKTSLLSGSKNGGESDPDAASNSPGEMEVLLCLRPIKYSKGNVPNGLGFQSLPKKSVKKASRRRERKGMPKQCTSAAVESVASQKYKESLVVCEALLVLSPSKGPPKKRNFVPEPVCQTEPQKKMKASVASDFRCMPNSPVPGTSSVVGATDQ